MKEDPILKVYETICDHNGIDYVRLDASQPDFWEQVSKLDLFIYRWAHVDNDHQLAKTILPVIENEMGIKCFPDLATSWHYDDKIKQYYLLKQHNFPIAQSWIFWDKKSALEWAKTAELPVVFKLKGGAGSSNVVLVRSRSKLRRLIGRMFGPGIRSGHVDYFGSVRFRHFNLKKEARQYAIKARNFLYGRDISPFWQKHKNYVYFQKFLPGNDHDTRVTITGERGFAFKRFVRPNDFRASGSNMYDMNRDRIDMNLVEIGFQISEKLGFQAMAYDFVYDEKGNPALLEMSYCYGDYPEYSTGYWDRDLKWHSGRYWPQYLELMDALNRPDLKLPDLEVTSPYARAKIVE